MKLFNIIKPLYSTRTTNDDTDFIGMNQALLPMCRLCNSRVEDLRCKDDLDIDAKTYIASCHGRKFGLSISNEELFNMDMQKLAERISDFPWFEEDALALRSMLRRNRENDFYTDVSSITNSPVYYGSGIAENEKKSLIKAESVPVAYKRKISLIEEG